MVTWLKFLFYESRIWFQRAHVVFMMDKVAVEQMFVQVHLLYRVNIIPPGVSPLKSIRYPVYEGLATDSLVI
jgi:hypothetical protein